MPAENASPSPLSTRPPRGTCTANSSSRAWSSSISERLKALTGGRAKDTTAVSSSHATRISGIAGHRTAPRGRALERVARASTTRAGADLGSSLPSTGRLQEASAARYTNYTFVSLYGADSYAPFHKQQQRTLGG